MTTTRAGIEDLLKDILDDSKPLPTQPSVARVAVNTALNSKNGRMGDIMTDDPRTLLEALFADAPPDAIAVAQSMEPMAEIELTEAKVTHLCDPPIFTDTDERERESSLVKIKMPEFTSQDLASTMDIRNFATLVTLNTARWHAKVKDRKASKNAATATGADEAAFETRKRLLVGADEHLKLIHKAIDEARVAHYEMTLPWSTTGLNDVGRRTGGRLLPNTLFVEYTTCMAKHKATMVSALNNFIPLYPSLIEQAKKKLGSSFDITEYPNPSSIASHFDLSFDFQPIPKGDDFKGLPQVQLDALARKINDNTQRMTENAMQDVWMRLYDVVGRMADRLSSPDKTFHDTLVENARDVTRLLSHLNVTSDARVEDIRKRVWDQLCQHDGKVLRQKQALRLQVGAMAQSIFEEMGK